MKYEIKKKTVKPFRNNDGDMMDYCWYNAVREGDGVIIQFGSSNLDYSEGESYEIEIGKFEGKGGKVLYKEIR
mgnify:CR=1 FL=1